MIKARIKNELFRVIVVRQQLGMLFFLLLFGLIFTYTGVSEYNGYIRKESTVFQSIPGKNGIQGNPGMRVGFIPSPNVVFFKGIEFQKSDEMPEDSLNGSFLGKWGRIGAERYSFYGFFGFLLLMGSFFMAVMGFTSYKYEAVFFKFGNILLRLVFLNLIFIMMAGISFLISLFFLDKGIFFLT